MMNKDPLHRNTGLAGVAESSRGATLSRQFKIGIRAGTSGTWSIYDVVRTADTLAVSSSGTVSIAAPAANAAGFTCNGSASTTTTGRWRGAG